MRRIPAKAKPVRNIVQAPHVRGPGKQVMRVSSLVSSTGLNFNRASEFITGRGGSGQGYSNSSGASARRATYVPEMGQLEQTARTNLAKAAAKVGKLGLSRCKCLGKCGCNA